MSKNHFFYALTRKQDFSEAILEITNQLPPHTTSDFILLFVSSKYNLENATDAIEKLLKCRVSLTTTSGEIYQGPFYESSIVALMIKCDQSIQVDQLNLLSIDNGPDEYAEKCADIEINLNPGQRSIGLLLIDGLSKKEEEVIYFLGQKFPKLPIIGGSAGDDLNFRETKLYIDNRLQSNCAQLLLIKTSIPFEIIKNQNYSRGNTKHVVTESNPVERIIYEINGQRAADFYAEQLNISPDQITNHNFSLNPIIVSFDDQDYVRSIQKINNDGSMTMYCAIESGMIITIGKMNPLIESVKELYQKHNKKRPAVSIFCECILRRLAILELSTAEQEEIFKYYSGLKAIGFHTYGEQVESLHVNQTLTGVVFYE